MTNDEIKLPWIEEAYKHLGLKEVPGGNHNKVILGWLSELKAWWHDDETPWCGAFVAHCMIASGFDIPKLWMTAKEWSNFGNKIDKPCYGCIVTFIRQGGGHVGFVVGETDDGMLVVLGGNQCNSVSLSKFSKDRVLAYVVPKYTMVYNDLPKMALDGNLSTNEA